MFNSSPSFLGSGVVMATKVWRALLPYWRFPPTIAPTEHRPARQPAPVLMAGWPTSAARPWAVALRRGCCSSIAASFVRTALVVIPHCSQIPSHDSRPHCLSHHLTQCPRRRRRCSAAERRGAHRSRAYREGQPLCLSLSVQSRWRRPNLDPSSSALPAVAALNTRRKHINLRCYQNQRYKHGPPRRRRLGKNRTRGSCCPRLPYELRRN